MIYNRSGHPVEIKKISVRLWALRDEIEAAISRRMKECEANGVPLFIDDIKSYYHLNMKAPMADQSNVIPLRKETPDAMNSMMESLGEEASPEAEKTEVPETFKEADNLIAEQSSQGLENKKPEPVIARPYVRLPPDLEKISYGFTLLSDINMENILTFTKEKFLQGQSVVIELLIPQNFIMTADVTYCHNYAMRSRIISTSKPDFRVQCKFTFAFNGERENLRNFLKSIEPAHLNDKKAPKKSSEEDLGI
jgi:acyl-CoA thioesterase